MCAEIDNINDRFMKACEAMIFVGVVVMFMMVLVVVL